jgi:hypothetical protein
MAYLIDLETHTDIRGNLTVIENVLPFGIERVFYIYGVDKSERGGHRHHKTIQAAVCIQGECKIFNNDGETEQVFHLNKPSKCVLLEPKDWHKMYDFSSDAILMVLASEKFDQSDYIYENYDRI